MDEPSPEQLQMWSDQKLSKRKKRWQNHDNALKIFAEKGIEFKLLDESTSHFRVGEWDFWGTTGTFLHRTTYEKGRGIFNLIEKLK